MRLHNFWLVKVCCKQLFYSISFFYLRSMNNFIRSKLCFCSYKLIVLHLRPQWHNEIPIEQLFCRTGQNSRATCEIPALIVISVVAHWLGVLVVVVTSIVVSKLSWKVSSSLCIESKQRAGNGGHHEPGTEHQGNGHSSRESWVSHLPGRGGVS